MKIQSEANPTATNIQNDDLNKLTHDQVENSTQEKIIEVTIPSCGHNEAILINPEAFNSEQMIEVPMHGRP